MLLFFKSPPPPPKISKLIMPCITTSTTVVLVSGSKIDFFYPNRGIRQGDPMSSDISIICMEMLSRYINHQVDITQWNLIKIFPTISYLCFANDLILIGGGGGGRGN